eukprot:XP_001706422.1 Hypothetical protein GL50803_37954 [Giardia lamblia ATCC 50803]
MRSPLISTTLYGVAGTRRMKTIKSAYYIIVRFYIWSRWSSGFVPHGIHNHLPQDRAPHAPLEKLLHAIECFLLCSIFALQDLYCFLKRGYKLLVVFY